MKKIYFLFAIIFLSINSWGQTPTFTWAKQMGTGAYPYREAIDLDISGNVYTAGTFQGTPDFDPGVGVFGLTSAGSEDAFISKLDASGNFVWAKRIGGTGMDRGFCITVDASGVYTTGFFSGTVDFDPGVGVFNMIAGAAGDIFISKLDASGNFVWAKRITGNSPNAPWGIALDGSSNVYITGDFINTVDFDPGVGTFNMNAGASNDAFICKLDVAGNFVWAKQFSGAAISQGISITVDAGNVYTTGRFSGGTTDFDPGGGVFNLTPVGVYDIFVSKLDLSGNFVWAKQMGGTGDDYGNSITVDGSGNVYTTGKFNSAPGDFDPGVGIFNMSTLGSWDMWISKLDASGNFVWAKQTGGVGADEGFSIAIDGTGNVYTTGVFQSGPVDFDPGVGIFNMSGLGGNDAFISKLDASGNFVWAGQLSGTSSEIGYGITIDPTNNLYVAGSFGATVDFDAGAGVFNMTTPGGDVFVTKYCQIPVQPGTISGTATICSGTTNTYSITAVSGATSYTWTLPGGWTGTSTTNSISATASATSGNITVTANNTCGNSSAQTLAITVNTLPATPGTISGTATICSGTTNTYSITAVAGATSYTWTLPSGWSGTSTTNSINTTASATSGNITVTANNTCGNSSAATLAITVNTIPATPGTISGTATICSGTTNTYSITAVAGATSYSWTLPSGWSGTSTTNSINATASATSGNITVTANNACGNSSPQTLAITVNTIPATPGTISGTTTICSGTTNTYSITAVAGATSYTWTLPGGWTGTSTTNSINATASATSGNITVTANNTCGNSTAATLAITVNTVPATPSVITGNASFCADATAQTYSVTNDVSATSYTWTLPSGWSGTSTTNSINATATSTGGTITVTANNGCGASAVQSLVVTVNPLPTVSLSLTVDTLCINAGVFTLTGESPSGGTFSGTAVSGGNFDPNAAGAGTHIITYTFTDGNSCTNTATDNIVVDLCLALPDEASTQEEIIVYPNPTTSVFTLSGVGGTATIEVYNVLGKIVLSQPITKDNTEINLSKETNGIYFITIVTKNNSTTKKIIKQ